MEKKVITEQTKALGKKIASQRKDIDKSKFPEAEKLLAQIEKATDDLAKAPPAKKDKALVELNKLTDALKDRQKQLGSPEDVNRQLQKLKEMASNGPADEFSKNLMKGDFAKAAQELKHLQEKLKSGSLTQKDKTALKEQLAEMSKQLEKLAGLEDRKKQLEEALKSGGLSKEQFKQEMAKLNEQSKSLQKLSKLASKLGEAHEALERGDLKKAAQALGVTERQVAEMAKNLEELQSLDGALADLQDAKNGLTGDDLNALGESLSRSGRDGRNRGNANNASKRGRGAGRSPGGRGRDRPVLDESATATRQGQSLCRRHRPAHRADQGPECHQHSRRDGNVLRQRRRRPLESESAPQHREAHSRLFRSDQQGEIVGCVAAAPGPQGSSGLGGSESVARAAAGLLDVGDESTASENRDRAGRLRDAERDGVRGHRDAGGGFVPRAEPLRQRLIEPRARAEITSRARARRRPRAR